MVIILFVLDQTCLGYNPFGLDGLPSPPRKWNFEPTSCLSLHLSSQIQIGLQIRRALYPFPHPTSMKSCHGEGWLQISLIVTIAVYDLTLARSPVASPFLCGQVEFRNTHPVWPVEILTIFHWQNFPDVIFERIASINTNVTDQKHRLMNQRYYIILIIVFYDWLFSWNYKMIWASKFCCGRVNFCVTRPMWRVGSNS